MPDKWKKFLTGRKFMVALATIIADLIIVQIPGLAEMHEELVKIISTIGGSLILTIAAEDAAFFWGAGKK